MRGAVAEGLPYRIREWSEDDGTQSPVTGFA